MRRALALALDLADIVLVALMSASIIISAVPFALLLGGLAGVREAAAVIAEALSIVGKFWRRA